MPFVHTQDEKYIQQAEEVIADVYRVLGRKRGVRIGEEPDRDGQYFHYLTKWMFALNQIGKWVHTSAFRWYDLEVVSANIAFTYITAFGTKM